MNLVFTHRMVEHTPKVFTAGCCQPQPAAPAPTELLDYFIVEEFADHATFSWDPYPGATGYNVYRSTDWDLPMEEWPITDANIPLSVLGFNCQYLYVRAITPGGLSPMPTERLAFCVTLPAVNYYINEEREFDATFTWDPYTGATGYNVYRQVDPFGWDLDNYELTEENIPVSVLAFNCQYIYVRAITQWGLTSQFTPLFYCQT